MKLITVFFALLALSLLDTVVGHTLFTTLFVNGGDQQAGVCIRMPMTPSNATYPVNSLSSDDMACGYDGTNPVARICTVPQSSALTFQFQTRPDGSQPGSIDPSHKGPCAVYMKSVTSPLKSTAVGDGWFKIMESTFNDTTKQWCTEELIKNNGLLSATIPSDLAGGYYLVRPELLALHQVDKVPPNPQFYVGCAQIFLETKATKSPIETVSIPGYVSIYEPGVLFSVWTPKWPYPGFGPKVYVAGQSPSREVETVKEQTEGLLPENAVLTNANWWGTELDPYSTEDGCWNASKACFEQCTTCYATAPPTGSKGCAAWDDYCTSIQAACNVNDFSGPSSIHGHRIFKSRSATPDTPLHDETKELSGIEIFLHCVSMLFSLILLFRVGYFLYTEWVNTESMPSRLTLSSAAEDDSIRRME